MERKVLFVCNQNSIRSVMGEGIMRHWWGGSVFVDSCGVHAGEVSGFAVEVMQEGGVDISGHRAKDFAELGEEGVEFDVVITMTPEAHHVALGLFDGARVEYWATPDPSVTPGKREQVLEAFRGLREWLEVRIGERFGRSGRI